MKHTVLITGGAGFIGSHLADRLIAMGYRVIVGDNFVTGSAKNIPKKAHHVHLDVTNKLGVDAVFKEYQFEYVFHLAGQASTMFSFLDPYTDIDINFIGTVNITMSAVKHGVSRLIYASSMTAYGNPVKLPIKESDQCAPISYYGITKYAAERFVLSTGARTDLKKPFHVTSIRMFNVYGPRQSLTNPYQGVMAIFLGNVLRNEPITIYGTGKQSRDFVYIDDAVNAWIKSIHEKKTFGIAMNIASGRDVTLLTLVDTIIKACGKDSRTYPIHFKKARPGDQFAMRADIELAKNLVGFVPRIELATGISYTVDWARHGV